MGLKIYSYILSDSVAICLTDPYPSSEVLLVTETRDERRVWMDKLQAQNPNLLKSDHVHHGNHRHRGSTSSIGSASSTGSGSLLTMSVCVCVCGGGGGGGGECLCADINLLV